MKTKNDRGNLLAKLKRRKNANNNKNNNINNIIVNNYLYESQ